MSILSCCPIRSLPTHQHEPAHHNPHANTGRKVKTCAHSALTSAWDEPHTICFCRASLWIKVMNLYLGQESWGWPLSVGAADNRRGSLPDKRMVTSIYAKCQAHGRHTHLILINSRQPMGISPHQIKKQMTKHWTSSKTGAEVLQFLLKEAACSARGFAFTLFGA